MAVSSSNPSSVVAAGTWATSTNVYTSDNTYATDTGATQNTEYPLDVGGFNFSAIPAGSTINSVTVTIEAKTGTNGRASLRAELYDGSTLINGSLTLTSLTNADANYTFAPTPTLTQLQSGSLKVRAINKRTVSQASTTSIDYIKIDVDYTAPVVAITQAGYQFYSEGTESTSASLAAQNVGASLYLGISNIPYQIRILLQSTTIATVPSSSFDLQYDVNYSNSWSSVASGYQVSPYSSPNLTDSGATTSRLTGGTGGFTAGVVRESSSAITLGWPANGYTELLWSVSSFAGYINNGDVLRFRVLKNSSTAELTYSYFPTITLTKMAPVDISDSTGLTDTGSADATRTFNGQDVIDLTDSVAAVVTTNVSDPAGLVDSAATVLKLGVRQLNRWNGSSWDAHTVKRWTGAIWKDDSPKYYDGVGWK